MEKRFILYKIYYGDTLVYLGRTKQTLQNRIRGHLFKSPRLKVIDINQVSKIEYANFKSEADMFLYEIYYINLYKPIFNKDDKAHDDLTVTMPEANFQLFITPLWDKWKKEINQKNIIYTKNKIEKEKFEKEYMKKRRELIDMLKAGNITADEFDDAKMKLQESYYKFLYKNGLIDFYKYKHLMGFKEDNSEISQCLKT